MVTDWFTEHWWLAFLALYTALLVTVVVMLTRRGLAQLWVPRIVLAICCVLIVANSFGEPPMSPVTAALIVINLLILFGRHGPRNPTAHGAHRR